MNDFSVQPVQEHLLILAETRLQNHPGMFQLLKHKLATGSPRALMILDCLQPGEWVYAFKKGRDFFSIDARLLAAIDSWVNSHPTSKTVVVPLPAPYLPAGEPPATVPVSMPTPKAAVVGQEQEAGINPPATVVTIAAPAAGCAHAEKADTVTPDNKAKKSDWKWTVIELAQSKCADPSDTGQVWKQMQLLIPEGKTGFTAFTAKGLEYKIQDDSVKYFTRDALHLRLHPERRAPRKKIPTLTAQKTDA